MKKKKSISDLEYQQMNDDQRSGFYIVCNDKMILENVDHLMKNRGYVGITDMRGHMHYLVDGRKSLYSAVHTIVKEVQPEKCAPPPSDTVIFLATEELFGIYGIDKSLVGSHLLRSMIYKCIKMPDLLKGLSKSLYAVVAEEYSMSPTQVERNVRYTIKKSMLADKGYQNVTALRFLYEEVVSWAIQKMEKLSSYEKSE